MIDRVAGVQNLHQDESSTPVHQSSTTHDSSRMHQLADAAVALGGINQSPVHTSTNSERRQSCDQTNTSEYWTSRREQETIFNHEQTSPPMNVNHTTSEIQPSAPALDQTCLDDSFLTAFDCEDDIQKDGIEYEVNHDDINEAIAMMAEDNHRKRCEEDDGSIDWFNVDMDNGLLESDHNGKSTWTLVC